MYQFFSGLITKENCIWDYDDDSHEDLIEKSGFADIDKSPNFVRVELLPKDKNIYNHNITNWQLKLDQDYKPDWFIFDVAEYRMRAAIKKVFKERFIISGQVKKEINGGRYYVRDGTINNFRDGTIEDFRNGTINNFWNGTIEDFRNGTINNFWNGTIEDFRNGTINNFWNGTIQIYTTIDVIKNIEPGAIVIDRKNKLIYTKEKYKILNKLK